MQRGIGTPKRDAPRLRAFLERQTGSRMLRMERTEWDGMRPSGGGEAIINLAMTPLSEVTERVEKVVATAEEVSSSGVVVRVYREDLNDPKPYNVDTYSVWEDLPGRSDFYDLIARSSTGYDDFMRSELDNHVYFVRRLDDGEEEGHWLGVQELPMNVRLAIGEDPPDS